MVNTPSQSCNPQRLDKTKLLIGEGKDEQRLFMALLKVLNLSESIQVEYYEGKDNLSRYLSSLLKRPGYQCLESLGIFRDADSSAKSAFQSVQDALNKAKLTYPSHSGQFTKEKPRVGIFILPDGISNGMLEDVCLAAVNSSPEMRCVE